jgi:glycosyltransferase involved in cell wall biosynthesis
VIVTNSLPGHDAGFAKSGHAHYLESFVANFVDRGFDTLLVIPSPRFDFLVLPAAALKYRVLSSALTLAYGRLVVTSPRVALTALAWRIYAQLPRPLQTTGSGLRSAVRRAQGFTHVLGAFIAPTERAFVERIVRRESPDIIVYDGIFTICGRLGAVPHWVITHEVKYQRAQSFVERGVAVRPAGFSLDDERALLASVGNVIAIQWDDGAEFERLLPEARVVVVPVTMAVKPAIRRDVAAARCIFVGSGSFHNVDGIRWFLDTCWPVIRAAIPEAELDVYGTVCLRLGELPSGVNVRGVAPDLAGAYADATLAVVPLQVGSGLKVKLVEALAHGLPVVTTSIGAQGLTRFEPRPFVLADSSAAFAEQCIRLLRSADAARQLSAAALRCAERFTPHAAFGELNAATAVSPPAVAPGAPVRVSIAIPTCRRTALLLKLLDGVARQALDGAAVRVEVIVLDNDPAAGAADAVERQRGSFPFPLTYEHVPQRGLTMVRNRALALAAERGDYIAMIDDDEVPEPQWLAELLRIARVTGADVVVGPVFTDVPADAPPWIAGLRAKETPVHPDGAYVREGWSCNALVATAAVARQRLAFDPALNLTGGEDQLFFRQMRDGGSAIAFAARAIVRESLAPNRLSVRFNLARAYRRGNSLSFCERRLRPGVATVAVRALKAVGWIAVGLLKMPVSLGKDEIGVVTGACDVASGLGMLAGLMGRMYQAYRQIT